MSNKNLIKENAVISEIFNQTSGRLISVSVLRTRDLKPSFVGLFQGHELPRGTCISCLYVGNDNIPFIEIKRYGSAAWRNIEKQIGFLFNIEQNKEKTEQLLLINQEVVE